MVRVDAEPLADGVEARPELARREAETLPLREHVVRRAEGGRVVDDGAAAQARAGDQRDALVVRRGRAAAAVEPAQAGPLRTVEVAFGPVAAGLEHDHVEAGLGEHGGRDAASCPGADDADVAVELEPVPDLERLEPGSGCVSTDAGRPGIADLLPAAGQEVGERERRLPQRLEAGPEQRHRAVAPQPQHRFPPRLREAGVAGEPRPEQQEQPLPLAGGQIVVDRVEHGVRHALLDGSWRERLADRVERAHQAILAGFTLPRPATRRSRWAQTSAKRTSMRVKPSERRSPSSISRVFCSARASRPEPSRAALASFSSASG